LREGKLDEAIRVAERNKKSHLAQVVNAGLLEFRVHEQSTEIPGERLKPAAARWSGLQLSSMPSWNAG
jgi:biopolymer transport protein ExbB